MKTLRKKEKMLVTSIFSFSHNVFYRFETDFMFSVTFIVSSANAFILDLSKILLFGKELNKLLYNQKFFTLLLIKVLAKISGKKQADAISNNTPPPYS